MPVEGGAADTLKDNAVWNSLKAVKNKHVYYWDDSSVVGPMPLGKLVAIDESMKTLSGGQ